MRLSYSFSRNGPAGFKTIGSSPIVVLPQKSQRDLAQLLNSSRSSHVSIAGLLPVYIRLPATSDPILLNETVRGVRAACRRRVCSDC